MNNISDDFYATWIDELNFVEAKSYKDTAPHEYVVIERLNPMNQEVCSIFGEFIKAKGYKENFYKTTFHYVNIGKYKYWLYKGILNRCPIENRYS